MNLLCPNCQKMLSVPEQYAGQTMKCPTCTGTFTVPSMPSGGMQAAPPPPPPPPTPSYTAEPMAAPPTGGYQHVYSISLRADVLTVLVPFLLFIVLILMFFTWIEAGISVGERVSSFTGWDTAFGEYSSGLGAVYAILFILTLLIAFASGVLPFVPPASLPPAVRSFLPVFPLVVGLGVLLCLLLLVLQLIGGFGPEQIGGEKLLEGVVRKQDVAVNFARSFSLRLVVFLEILAIVASALTAWLNLRGNQPRPRVDFTW